MKWLWHMWSRMHMVPNWLVPNWLVPNWLVPNWLVPQLIGPPIDWSPIDWSPVDSLPMDKWSLTKLVFLDNWSRMFCMSRGKGCRDPEIRVSNWLGSNCPGGPNFWAPFVHGDQIWRGPFVPVNRFSIWMILVLVFSCGLQGKLLVFELLISFWLLCLSK